MKYRMWDTESMERAVADVDMGMSLRMAAELYGIPKTTLNDYVLGKREFGAKSGYAYLTDEEEQELASFLTEVAKIGYPRTKKEVLTIVQQIVNSKGIAADVTKGWWDRFVKRHPSLTLKTAVPLTLSRAKAGSKEVLDRYFDILQDCLEENGILNNPAVIYNCDETGLPLNPECHKVVEVVGSRHPSYITGEGKQQFTVLACTSATGVTIPPFVVLDDKNLNFKFTLGEVPGTLYGLSPNGWMTQDLFHGWFTNHFLQYATPQRPLILLMDGHSSHYCPETITLAAENQVILFILPPNTTHITQPLDRACFSPLKAAWRETCHRFVSSNPGKRVTKYDFCRLFSEAWSKAMTMSNVISSFRVTGIFPFNREMAGEESRGFSEPKTLAERTGLAYIPLYSPVRLCTRSPGLPQQGASEPSTPPVPTVLDKAACLQKSAVCTAVHSPEPDGHFSGAVSPSHGTGISVPLRHKTTISDFLTKPPPPSAQAPKSKNAFGQVLTSQESLEIMKEKQHAKEMKKQMQQDKQRMREEKAKKSQLKKVKSKYKHAICRSNVR